MFESLKKKIGSYIIKKRFLKDSQEVNFNNFIKDSLTFFVIMPANEHDIVNTFEILNLLIQQGKSITILCYAPRINTIPTKEKYKFISFDMHNLSKFNLPAKDFLMDLENREFDVVIDLNNTENLFCSAMTNFFKSKYRIGFQKTNSDSYYNFQVQNDERNSEISYRNLLNSIQMF